MTRRAQLAVLLAVALLVIFALWPEPAAGDVPIVARVISFTPSTPRSAPDNRMGDALTGRTLADQGRTEGPTPPTAVAPARWLGVAGGPSPTAAASAECREWALGCGRYPALATVGSSPSAAAQPVRTASALPASMTGNSSAILKGSIRGVGSWMPERFGADYLALPEGAGVRVKLCGAARCVVMTSNDAGPSLAMQRKGRIVDLSAALFKAITGLPLSRGIAWVTVRRIE